MIREDMHIILLHLYDAGEACPTCGTRRTNPGKNLGEFTSGLGWEKQRTARTIGTAENFGMLRGNWERISETNQRWTRRYYLAGRATMEFVEVLKKVQSSTPTTKKE